MTAFDTAWDLTKFDVHFTGRSSHGHHKEASKIKPHHKAADYTGNNRYNEKRKMTRGDRAERRVPAPRDDRHGR